MKKFPKSVLCILLGLVLCLVSIVGTRTTMTNFGATDIQSATIISESGFKLAMDLYIPENATAERPAPVIMVQHGGNNNKEEMELYCIELARRGYVAIGVDMYGMGESQALPDSQWLTAGRGLYDAVKFAVTLPYVDADRLSLLGYSRGGKAAGEALQCDNDELNVVKAIYLIHSDPIVRNTEGYTDVYGARDVAVLADKYDEFFFSEKANDNGTYSNDANKYAANLSSPADYIINNSAQAFLYFGDDPANHPEQRVAETVYSQEYSGGGVGTRMISVSSQTHMAGWYSPLIMTHVLEFFDRVMPTNSGLPASNHIYSVTNIFSLIGIAGLLTFLVAFVLWLVTRVGWFQPADQGVPELRPVNGSKGAVWFWGLQALGIVVSILIIMFLNMNGLSAYRDAIFRSANPLYHGLISLLCGAFTLIMAVVWYFVYGKKNGFDLNGVGIAVGGKRLWKTVVAAVLGVGLMELLVFATDYLFQTDYLFVFWGFMPFGAERIPGMLLVLPMYLAYYIVMSVSVNCFNFNDAVGKIKWVGRVVASLLAALPTLLIIAYVYGVFKATGWNPMFGGLASSATAVIALPGFIFVAIFNCRVIYEKCGNPYLGGIINGIAAAIVEWGICEQRVPDAGQTFPVNGLLVAILVVGFGAIAACAVLLAKAWKEKGASSRA